MFLSKYPSLDNRFCVAIYGETDETFVKKSNKEENVGKLKTPKRRTKNL